MPYHIDENNSDVKFKVDKDNKVRFLLPDDVSSLPAKVEALMELIAGGSVDGSAIKQVFGAFLSKLDDDTASGLITFLQGLVAEGRIQVNDVIQFGKYISGLVGGSGGIIDSDGNAVLESLILRGFAEFPELRQNRVDVVAGELWNSIAFGVIESVDTDKRIASIKLEEGERCGLKVDDICRGIFCNFGSGTQSESVDECGFQTIYGFSTSYFTPIEILVDEPGEFRFRYAIKANTTVHPCAIMKFAVYGNFTNASRQASAYMTRTYTRYLSGVNTWSIDAEKNIYMQTGKLDGLTINGTELKGYGTYQTNSYLKGVQIQLSKTQKEELNGESAYSVSLTDSEAVVVLDDEGNIIKGLTDSFNVISGDKNVVSGDYNVITKDFTVKTRVQAFRGSDELFYSPSYEEGSYTISFDCTGCEAVILNGVIIVKNINKDIDAAYVDIYVSCEGNATFNKRFTITAVRNGRSPITADLSNEMDAVACDSDGNVLFGLPLSTSVSMWYGTTTLTIDKIELGSVAGVTATVSGNVVKVTGMTAAAAAAVQLPITAYATYMGEQYHKTLTFTVTKQLSGENARIYQLQPSVTSIKVDEVDVRSVDYVSCGVTAYDGKSVSSLSSLPAGLSIKYQIDSEAIADYVYKSDIATSSIDSTLTFSLYNGTTIIDRETIPVVIDGKSVVVADLTNEMCNVACDADGNYVAGLPFTTQVKLYYASHALTLSGITLGSANGVTAVSKDDGTVIISSVTSAAADRTELPVTMTGSYGKETYTRTINIIILKTRGGANAVAYDLLPSVNVVAVAKDGQKSADYVSCKVRCIDGKNEVTTPGSLPVAYSMKYSVDGGSESSYTYGGNIPVGATEIAFMLYYNSIMIDKETIPVVYDGADGADGKDGANGKDGTNGKDGVDGKNGENGKDGKDGVDGKDGSSVGITDQSVTYAISTTESQPSDDKFVYTSVPSVPKGSWLWSRTYVLYSDGNSNVTYGKMYQGADGLNGTSVTIVNTSIQYGVSSSASVKPTTWYAVIPNVGNGSYLWNWRHLTYSDGTETDEYTYAYQGMNGTNGENGKDGTNGTDGTNGVGVRIIYRYDIEKPDTPTGNTPAGWRNTSEQPTYSTSVEDSDFVSKDGYYYSPETTEKNGVYTQKLNIETASDNTILFIDLHVSSEANYDFAYIGNLDTDSVGSSNYLVRLSGESTQIVKVNIPTAGSHYIMISYQKDASQDSGDDRLWYRLISVSTCYMSVGEVDGEGNITWTTPVMFIQNSQTKEYVYLLSDLATLPLAPTNDKYTDGYIPAITDEIYDDDTTYSAGDKVIFGAYFYRCVKGVKGVNPINTEYWKQILSWASLPQNVSESWKYQYTTYREKNGGIWGAWKTPYLFNVYASDGKQGATGAMLSFRGLWNKTTKYVNNSTECNCVEHNGSFYILLVSESTGDEPPTDISMGDNNGIWQMGSFQDFFATNTLLANGANLAGFSFTHLKDATTGEDMMGNGGYVGVMQSVEKTADGQPMLSLNSQTGEIVAQKGTFKGDVTAESGLTKVRMSAKAGEEGMRILYDSIEKTSFLGSDKTASELFSEDSATANATTVTSTASNVSANVQDYGSEVTIEGKSNGVNLAEELGVSEFTVDSPSIVSILPNNANKIIGSVYINFSNATSTYFEVSLEITIREKTAGTLKYQDTVSTYYDYAETSQLTSPINAAWNGCSLSLGKGTYTLTVSSMVTITKRDDSGAMGNAGAEFGNFTLTIDPTAYRSMFFGNGFAMGSSLLQHIQTYNINGVQHSECVSGGAGWRVNDEGLQLKMGGTWYVLSMKNGSIQYEEI